MEWSKERILIFIKHYKSEPILWKSMAKGQKGIELVHNAWVRIHNSLGWDCKIDDMKKKRDSLMAGYRSIINRKRKAIRNGEEPEQITWFAFDALHSFLGPVYETQTDNNETSEDDSEDQGRNIAEQKKEWSVQNTGRSLTETNANPPRQAAPGAKRVKKASCTIGASGDDDCDIFGKLVVKKIRKIHNFTMKETVMNDIHHILWNARMRDAQVSHDHC
ncbi:uncharacterized protein LOC113495272 [Trichoplusia ni]|uniref:Uncharacterized protein LOC113495272 n=1 Tax=Trichoplusia ni TaxID=7111 RepID=A0A7E5VN42_TRINI|nr:uncharacterized protein LOC113495272 [Trichoplusia ni]